MKHRPSLALALALALLAAHPAVAQAWGVAVPLDADCLQTQSYAAVLAVDGERVDTDVTWTVAAPADGAGEVVLVIPGAVTAPAVTVDGVAVAVEAVAAADAPRVLADLATERGDPSALRFAGQAVHLARFSLGEVAATVRIEGASRASLDHGVLHLVHPHRPGWSWCGPAGEVSVEVRLADIDGLPAAAVLTPYHDSTVTRDGAVVVRATEPWAVPAFDFELLAAPADGPVGAAVAAWRAPACDGEPADDGQFVLFAAPDPQAAGQPPLPKDVVLVMDSSGSMGGDKIVQARAAAAYVLDHLGPDDRFDLIDFDGAVRSLFGALRPVSADALQLGRGFVAGMDAEGSTNIHDALLEALGRFPAGDGRPDFVVFVTDGAPTEGVTDRDAIVAASRQANRREARVFPFGVGYDVNTFLLDGLAAAHFGVSSYIRPGQDIAQALASFYDRIRSPVMTRIALAGAGVTPTEVLPRALPDLFEGGSLLAVGRFTDADAGSVLLAGDVDGDADPEVVTPRGRLVRRGDALGFVPRLHAARLVGDLIAADRADPGDAARVDRIRALARRFGLVTPFTAFHLDEGGNVVWTYDRPTSEESGARSVGHSSDVNSMNANESAGRYGGGAAAAGSVRHLGDRTFVVEDGYWVDTTADAAAVDVDVTFGGDAWAALLESNPGAAGLLSMGRNVVFRHGCAVVRVTDPAVAEEDPPREVPLETPSAGALDAPAEAPAWMDPAPDDAVDAVAVGFGAPPDDTEAGSPDSHAVCAVADPGAAPGFGTLLALLAIVGFRRRAIVRRGWTGTAWRRSTNASARSCGAGPGRSCATTKRHGTSCRTSS